RDALAAKAVVVIALVHAAHLESVLVLNPRQIVVERVDGVFRTVVGLAAPGSVTLAEAQPQQVLVTVRNARQANLILPVIASQRRRLRWIVILAPVVAARVEVVEQRRAEGMIPAHSEHVAVALRVVVIGVEAGKDALAALRPRIHVGARAPVVA